MVDCAESDEVGAGEDKMNKLKEIRKDMGFTRESLADATDLTARAIKHWEDG